MDCSFLMRRYTYHLDSLFKSYEVFKILAQARACCQPLSKSAQNCQNLTKFAQKWNFEIPPKIEILVCSKKKNLHVEGALGHVSIVWIFNPRIFHMLFLLSKNGLCMWISAYPLAENDFFFNVPHLLSVWDFDDMYLTH
jgi:hypothetical protein